MTYESNCTRRLRPRLFGRGGGAVEEGEAVEAALVEEEDEVEEEAVEVEATEWSDSVPSCSEPYPLSELVSMSCRSSFSTSRLALLRYIPASAAGRGPAPWPVAGPVPGLAPSPRTGPRTGLRPDRGSLRE